MRPMVEDGRGDASESGIAVVDVDGVAMLSHAHRCLVMCGVCFVLSSIVSNVLMFIDTKLLKPMFAAASRGDYKRLVITGVTAVVLLFGSYAAVQIVNPSFDFVNSEARAAYEKEQAERANSVRANRVGRLSPWWAIARARSPKFPLDCIPAIQLKIEGVR